MRSVGSISGQIPLLYRRESGNTKASVETQIAPVDSIGHSDSWIRLRLINRRTEGSNPEHGKQSSGLTKLRRMTCDAHRKGPFAVRGRNSREIERRDLNSVEYGMKRFHRAISITLLLLASLLLIVELFRAGGLYPRIVLVSVLTLFCVTVQRLCAGLSQGIPKSSQLSRP